MSEGHTELEIHISTRTSESTYLVEARLNDDRYFRSHIEIDLEHLRVLYLRHDIQGYGATLFRKLFKDEIRTAYDRAIELAENESGGRLRIRLWVEYPKPELEELHHLRWEALLAGRDQNKLPLSIDDHTPFSRYVNTTDDEAKPIKDRPLKMLFAVSNPSDLENYGLTPIAVAEEISSFLAAIKDLQQSNQVEVAVMPGRNETKLSENFLQDLKDREFEIISGATSLKNILEHMENSHIFHFLGHGIANEAGSTLILEDDSNDKLGSSKRTSGSDFAGAAKSLIEKPYLIFLSSCDTAKYHPDTTNPFTALAPKLVSAGVPAAIAMQDKVHMDVARELTRRFYHRLLSYGYVDRALNSARRLIYYEHKWQFQWTVPALYTRLSTGQLFGEDPVHSALEQVRTENRQEYKPLPIEVVHMIGRSNLGSLDRMEQSGLSGLGILDAIDQVFKRDSETDIQSKTKGDSQDNVQKAQANFALLIGWRGSAKTSQFKSIARHTARKSLEPDNNRPIIPVIVDLRDYPYTLAGSQTRLERMVQQSLESVGLKLTEKEFEKWLKGNGQAVLRIMLDSGADLGPQWRQSAIEAIRNFIDDYPQHEYIMSIDRRYFDANKFEFVTSLLIILPLSPRTIHDYLTCTNIERDLQFGKRLYDTLNRHRLFDLAASPWLLYQILRQAEHGIVPRSRVEVLGNVVDTMLEPEIPSNTSLRQIAERSLEAVAWDMQWNRHRSRNEKTVYETLKKERKYREYELDTLYGKLLRSGILTRVGTDMVQFAYGGIQAFYCARAIIKMPFDEREHLIDDITASLGRLTRLWWWEETLILLSGMIDDANQLLRAMDFGMDILRGEHLFLMARCILENGPKRISAEIRRQVVGNLILRLDKEIDHRPARRANAADLLGQLNEKSAADDLAEVVQSQTEGHLEKGLFDDDNIVRMRAAFSLKAIVSASLEEKSGDDVPPKEISPANVGLEKDFDLEMFKVLKYWVKGNEQRLVEQLDCLDVQEIGALAVAAFALGDLNSENARASLYAAFLDPSKSRHTRWAITDALTMLDTTEVTKEVVRPLLKAVDEDDRQEWREFLAYLIGRMNLLDDDSLKFLDHCLNDPGDIYAAAEVIESLGLLNADEKYVEIFEQIAIAEESHPVLEIAGSDEEKRLLIRKKAIEALSNIGTRQTIENLYREHADWPNDLQDMLYLAAEEIDWRLEYGPRR